MHSNVRVVSRPFARSLIGFGLLLLASIPSACRTPKADDLVDGTSVDRAVLDRTAPVDVVVLPIEDRTLRRTFGDFEETLRESLAKRLVDLSYSAVRDRSMIDQRLRDMGLTEASMVSRDTLSALKFRFEEDAILGVRIDSWELARLDETPPSVRFSAEILMMNSKTGEVIASGPINGQISPSDGVPPSTRRARADAAAERLGPILLRSLAARPSGEAPTRSSDG